MRALLINNSRMELLNGYYSIREVSFLGVCNAHNYPRAEFFNVVSVSSNK